MKRAFVTAGHEVTVDDAKARREPGDKSTTPIAEGLAAMRAAQ